MQQRLAELGTLKDGWDGEGSLAISPKVLTFVGNVLGQSNANLLNDWVLFPDARGYIYFDYTHGKNIAGITIAENGMTAFVKKNGELRKCSYAELSEDKVIKITFPSYAHYALLPLPIMSPAQELDVALVSQALQLLANLRLNVVIGRVALLQLFGEQIHLFERKLLARQALHTRQHIHQPSTTLQVLGNERLRALVSAQHLVVRYLHGIPDDRNLTTLWDVVEQDVAARPASPLGILR